MNSVASKEILLTALKKTYMESIVYSFYTKRQFITIKMLLLHLLDARFCFKISKFVANLILEFVENIAELILGTTYERA